MKKLFTFVFLVVVTLSFGGTILSAHADTALTPAQAGAFQAQLDILKGNLATLQAQAATPVPATASAPNASSLKPEDAAALRSMLASLTMMLASLQAKLAANPEFATQKTPAVFSALQGMTKTLATIGTVIGTQSVASNRAIAYLTPAPAPILATSTVSPVVLAPTAPASLTPVATPTQPLVSAPADQVVNTNQVAQIGSSSPFKNLNWPLIIVVILVIGAVALWLFWPENNAEKRMVKVTTVMPTAPSTTVTAQQQSPKPYQPYSHQQNQQQPRKSA